MNIGLNDGKRIGKRFFYFLCVFLALTACATPMTYEKQRQLAKQNDNDQLCLVTIVKPEYKKAAEDELADRNAKCDWDKVKIMIEARNIEAQKSAQQKAYNDMMIMQSLQILNGSIYTQPQQSHSTCYQQNGYINCTSW